MDMAVCMDMSLILRQIDNANHPLRKLFICEKCRVAFVKRRTYDDHIGWCKGTNLQQFIFSKEILQTFEEHVNHRETPPAMIYYDLETSSSKEEIKVISDSFKKEVLIPSIIAYRSMTMSLPRLLLANVPAEVKDRISDGDKDKLSMCTYDVQRKKPHAMCQLFTMEMIMLQRAISLVLNAKTFYRNVLPPNVVNAAMVDYGQYGNCSLSPIRKVLSAKHLHETLLPDSV